YPLGMCVDRGRKSGGTATTTTVFWCEWGAHTIRSMDVTTEVVRTVAGVHGKSGYKDGACVRGEALFNAPHAVTCDQLSDGQTTTVWVADNENARIRAIHHATTPLSATVSTLLCWSHDKSDKGLNGDTPDRIMGVDDRPRCIVHSTFERC